MQHKNVRIGRLQAYILDILDYFGSRDLPAKPTEIAAALGGTLHRNTVPSAVRRLRERGLVRACTGHLHGSYRITDAGAAALKEWQQANDPEPDDDAPDDDPADAQEELARLRVRAAQDLEAAQKEEARLLAECKETLGIMLAYLGLPEDCTGADLDRALEELKDENDAHEQLREEAREENWGG